MQFRAVIEQSGKTATGITVPDEIVAALEPTVPVTVKTLRPTARPNSLVTRAFTRCMTQALQQLA